MAILTLALNMHYKPNTMYVILQVDIYLKSSINNYFLVIDNVPYW